MKSLLKVTLGVLFLAGMGMAFADEGHDGDHHDDHIGARVVIVPAHHHRRRHHYHPAPRSGVSLNIGIGDHHDDRHDDDHHDDHH